MLIYASIIYSKKYSFNLQSLLPIATAVATCGIIITHKFPEEITKKYRVSKRWMLLSDVRDHIGPLFALVFLGARFSKTKNIHKIYTLLVLLLYIGGDINNIRIAYPGVPDWVFVFFVFLIVIS